MEYTPAHHTGDVVMSVQPSVRDVRLIVTLGRRGHNWTSKVFLKNIDFQWDTNHVQHPPGLDIPESSSSGAAGGFHNFPR